MPRSNREEGLFVPEHKCAATIGIGELLSEHTSLRTTEPSPCRY